MNGLVQNRQLIAAGAVTLALLGLIFVIPKGWLTGAGSEAQVSPSPPVFVLTPVPTYTSTPAAPAQLSTGEGPEEAPEASAENPAAPAPQPTFPPGGEPFPAEAETGRAATAVPSPTPTGTPAPPTPTPVVDELLAEAARLHRYGYYAEEQALLLRFLDEGSDPAALAEARYRLGESYLADGQYATALATLDAFIGDAGGAQVSSLTLDATFLRGEALAGLGRYEEALAAYTLFSQSDPSLAQPLAELMAQVYRDLRNWQAAGDAYRQAAASAATTSEQARLLEAAATSYESGRLYAQAAAAYDQILAFAVQPAYRTGILYRAGSAHAAGGDDVSAVSRWEQALTEGPTLNSAHQSLIELVNRNVPVDDFQRGFINVNAGAFTPAIAALERFLATGPTGDARGNTLLYLGQAHLGMGNWAEAIGYLERVTAEHPNCACFGQAWLDRARLEISRGDDVAGRRLYRTFAREHPTQPLAPEALWRSALSAIAADNQLEAGIDILTLVDAFPQSERAANALYVLGIGTMSNGLYAQAQESFARLVADYPTERWQAALYWLGRAYAARGNLPAAQEQWRALVKREPDTYYGILAGIALNRQGEFGAEIFRDVAGLGAGPSTLAGDDGSQRFAEDWLGRWLGVSPAGLGSLPASVAADSDLLAGARMLRLDRRGVAMSLFNRAYQRYRDNPAALYALSLHFQELGAYSYTIITGERLIALSPARLVADAPSFIQRLAYPRPFRELVEREALANEIDPLLFFSLLRQESLFEEGARSFAAAQGLAQVIPTTGQEIAGRLNFPNYTNDLIYRPHINLRFGAFYLAWTRNFLNGDITAALAGYNAGPGNGRRWQNISSDDTFFVELMDYSEPRLYIQRILAHYYHYTRLYD